jgi:predicted MFS family arabinose efflux permease
VAAKLSALQLSFALTWVVYVIYLPALAAQAGIDKRFVPWILMMDQAIFIACDWAAGVYADRVGNAMKRIGEPMAIATLASCAAFIALPFVAPMAGAAAFLALTAIWSATSSALRAPALALVSRHVPDSSGSWVAGVFLLGLGVASGLAPYLTLALKGVDPRIPFVAVSLALALFTLLLAQAERQFEPAPKAGAPGKPAPSAGRYFAFALAVLLLAIGFQVHFSINSAPAWGRVLTAAELPWFMPIFWLGFNLAVLPATILPRRHGGMRVMAMAAGLGVIAMAPLGMLSTREALAAAQFAAGAAWAVALTAAFTAALETGRPGREGLLTGALFSVLAIAAFARLAATSGGIQSHLELVPALAWSAAALITLGLATAGPARGQR